MKRFQSLLTIFALAFITAVASADSALVKIWYADRYPVGTMSPDGTITPEPVMLGKFTQTIRPLPGNKVLWKNQTGTIEIPDGAFEWVSIRKDDISHQIFEVSDDGILVTSEWQKGGYIWVPRRAAPPTLTSPNPEDYYAPIPLGRKVLWSESIRFNKEITRVVCLLEKSETNTRYPLTQDSKKLLRVFDVSQLQRDYLSREMRILAGSVVVNYGPVVEFNDREVFGQISISPDGKKVAYSGFVPEFDKFKISVVEIETGKKKLLFPEQINESEYYPLWSPDGSKIGFALHDRDGEYACVYDLETKSLTQAKPLPDGNRYTHVVGWRRSSNPPTELRNDLSNPSLR